MILFITLLLLIGTLLVSSQNDCNNGYTCLGDSYCEANNGECQCSDTRTDIDSDPPCNKIRCVPVSETDNTLICNDFNHEFVECNPGGGKVQPYCQCASPLDDSAFPNKCCPPNSYYDGTSCQCNKTGATLNLQTAVCECPAGTTETADACTCDDPTMIPIEGECKCPPRAIDSSCTCPDTSALSVQEGDCICPISQRFNADYTQCVCQNENTEKQGEQCICKGGKTGVFCDYDDCSSNAGLCGNMYGNAAGVCDSTSVPGESVCACNSASSGLSSQCGCCGAGLTCVRSGNDAYKCSSDNLGESGAIGRGNWIPEGGVFFTPSVLERYCNEIRRYSCLGGTDIDSQCQLIENGNRVEFSMYGSTFSCTPESVITEIGRRAQQNTYSFVMNDYREGEITGAAMQVVFSSTLLISLGLFCISWFALL